MKAHHKGIHHITAMAGDPKKNHHFYTQTLGMRMVKKSVNQDDPTTYHLFYGNHNGTPGSSLTFFPWPRAAQGKAGTGEAVAVALSVPEGSLEYWSQRLEEAGINVEGPNERFGHSLIRFKDPDNIRIEIVDDKTVGEIPYWPGSPVPESHGIRGFWGTTLKLQTAASTAPILTDLLGFTQAERDENMILYRTDAPIGNAVMIEETSDPQQGRNGHGIIHHVAFRTKNDEELEKLRQEVARIGLHPTEIIDRHWFHSVYFRTPGGVLFEMATDGPGYDVDEDPGRLGEKLILPPWLESRRKWIESKLPEIE